jgi:hypothetical protein
MLHCIEPTFDYAVISLDISGRALPCSAVVSRGVRRVWVTVLVGVFGLVVGLTTGFAVGLLSRRKVDAAWLEAVGTWFGGGITLLAVTLAGIVFLSEEFTRRREQRRQQEADERAEQDARVRLQREANLVICDIRPAVSRAGTNPHTIIVDELEVDVQNRSSHVITGLRFTVRRPGFIRGGICAKRSDLASRLPYRESQ